MNVLFDENMPMRLRHDLPGHEVRTVVRMGWGSIQNGDLLRRASHDFDVLLTCDLRMQFQQNVPNFDIAVFVLSAPKNDFAHLRPLMPQVLALLTSSLTPGTVTVLAESVTESGARSRSTP